jgi:hypothetical protein
MEVGGPRLGALSRGLNLAVLLLNSGRDLTHQTSGEESREEVEAMRKVQGEAKMQGRVVGARGQQRVRTVQDEAARNIALLRIAGACVVGNQKWTAAIRTACPINDKDVKCRCGVDRR